MAKSHGAEANVRWREQAGVEQDPELASGGEIVRSHPAAGRPGHTDPKARPQDIDADSVDAAGIPIARWADRGMRTHAIALGHLVWSAATIACGLA